MSVQPRVEVGLPSKPALHSHRKLPGSLKHKELGPQLLKLTFWHSKVSQGNTRLVPIKKEASSSNDSQSTLNIPSMSVHPTRASPVYPALHLHSSLTQSVFAPHRLDCTFRIQSQVEPSPPERSKSSKQDLCSQISAQRDRQVPGRSPCQACKKLKSSHT